MQTQFKKYLSIFLLFLFLFPIVETEVHAYKHSFDKHCVSTDKHFHPLEHHCSICDFTITNSSIPPSNNYLGLISSSVYFYNPFIESVNKPTAFQDLPSRAPPIA